MRGIRSNVFCNNCLFIDYSKATINHKFCPLDLQKLIFLKKHDYRNKINSFLLLENVVCVLSERQEVPLSYLP